ncbi:myeloid leukemia factor 2 isoform 3-T3 [Vipera latastei]
MFRFMRDGEPEDPMFMMDPLAIHQQHVNRVLSGGFGYSPFLSIGNGTVPGTRQVSRRMQAGTVSPFGMLGMAGGFMDMFGMMNDMIGNMEHMTSGANCQTFTSSTVISYSNLGEGPKVYQETSETRSAPGGVRNRLLHLTKCLKKHQDWLIHWAFICMSTHLRENKMRDPGDAADGARFQQWTGADVNWAPHQRACTHYAALTQPSHR